MFLRSFSPAFVSVSKAPIFVIYRNSNMLRTAILTISSGIDSSCITFTNHHITKGHAMSSKLLKYYLGINMGENREIINADGHLVGTLKNRRWVLNKFTYAEESRNIEFILSAEDLAGVTSIADWAFAGCRSLTSIKIPNSVTSIDWGGGDECTSLQHVTLSTTSKSLRL